MLVEWLIPDLFLSGSKSIKVRTAVTFLFSCISVKHLNKLVLVQSKHQIFCFIRPKSPGDYNGTGCDGSSGCMHTNWVTDGQDLRSFSSKELQNWDILSSSSSENTVLDSTEDFQRKYQRQIRNHYTSLWNPSDRLKEHATWWFVFFLHQQNINKETFFPITLCFLQILFSHLSLGCIPLQNKTKHHICSIRTTYTQRIS